MPEEPVRRDAGRRTRLELSVCWLQAFFKHVDRPMRIMADLLRRGRFADEIMPMLAAEKAESLRKMFATTGRNDPCRCGSGRKFKHCHGQQNHPQP
jgi:uncharacterized protein